MMFMTVEAIKTVDNRFYIEWEMRSDNPPESVDDLYFKIQYSRNPEDGFEYIKDGSGSDVLIDGAIGPLSYTHDSIQFTYNWDNYYQVQAILKSDETNTFYSDVTYVGPSGQGVHETIKYAESILNDYYIGEPFYLLKRKITGTKCPRCWSATRQQRLYSHCDICNSVGTVNGFYKAIEVQIATDSNPVKSDSQKEFEDQFSNNRGRMTNYPLVAPKDILVCKDDSRRYDILHVDTTKLPRQADSKIVLSKQNYIISQILTLVLLNPSDSVYNVPLQL